MSSQDTSSVYGILTETLVMAPSVTVMITPLPGQISATLKWFSGGSLSITSASLTSGGCTFASANAYLVGTTEVVNMNLAGNIYLMASGATCTAYLLRGRSAGFTV